MRKPLLTLTLIAACFILKAQAYEDKIEYNKEKQACIVMEYDFPPLAVENAVVAKMNKLGYKGKEEKVHPLLNENLSKGKVTRRMRFHSLFLKGVKRAGLNYKE